MICAFTACLTEVTKSYKYLRWGKIQGGSLYPASGIKPLHWVPVFCSRKKKKKRDNPDVQFKPNLSHAIAPCTIRSHPSFHTRRWLHSTASFAIAITPGTSSHTGAEWGSFPPAFDLARERIYAGEWLWALVTRQASASLQIHTEEKT